MHQAGPGLLSLVAHTPGFCQSLTIKVEQNSRNQPRRCGHLPVSAAAEVQGTQLAHVVELLALLPLSLVLHAAQMGKG